jgi:hypothetical protein
VYNLVLYRFDNMDTMFGCMEEAQRTNDFSVITKAAKERIVHGPFLSPEAALKKRAEVMEPGVPYITRVEHN